MNKNENLGGPESGNPSNEDIERMTAALRKMAERESPRPEEPEKAREGLVGGIREKVRKVVNESGLSNEDYESTVGVYGGKMKTEDGKMVWDRTGMVSGLDAWGDRKLRTADDHVVREPKKLLKKHPKIALGKFFAPGAKRYRGSNEEIIGHIEDLGLSEYYGPHEKGIEIKKPEIYKHGLALQDIYRSDLIKSKSGELEKTDRFQALAEAGKYIREIHSREHGGIGELLVSDIIFQECKDGKLGRPVLNLPDIVWNKKKNTSEVDKKNNRFVRFFV